MKNGNDGYRADHAKIFWDIACNGKKHAEFVLEYVKDGRRNLSSGLRKRHHAALQAMLEKRRLTDREEELYAGWCTLVSGLTMKAADPRRIPGGGFSADASAHAYSLLEKYREWTKRVMTELGVRHHQIVVECLFHGHSMRDVADHRKMRLSSVREALVAALAL